MPRLGTRAASGRAHELRVRNGETGGDFAERDVVASGARQLHSGAMAAVGMSPPDVAGHPPSERKLLR
jgi:hypothetical protein